MTTMTNEAIADTRTRRYTGLTGWQSLLFVQSRKNAKARGHAFDLTPDHFRALLARADGACMLTGIPFDLDLKVGASDKRPYAPSLDRIDARRGYEPGNVRLVCVAVNLAMNRWGLPVLERIGRALVGDAYARADNRGRLCPPGVARRKRKNGYRYCARVVVAGKTVELGTFKTVDEASAIYEKWRRGSRDSNPLTGVATEG